MGRLRGSRRRRFPVASLQDEREPVDDVEDEEEDGKGDEEELVYPPVLLGQLLQADGAAGRALLHLILEVVLAHDFDVHAVLPGHVALLLEQDGRVPAKRKGGYKRLLCIFNPTTMLGLFLRPAKSKENGSTTTT